MKTKSLVPRLLPDIRRPFSNDARQFSLGLPLGSTVNCLAHSAEQDVRELQQFALSCMIGFFILWINGHKLDRTRKLYARPQVRLCAVATVRISLTVWLMM